MWNLLRRSSAARRLVLARALTVWGNNFYVMAAMWTTLEITGSTWQMALIAVAEIIPYLLFSPVAGALADRWDQRRTRILLDLFQAVVVAAVPVLYFAGVFSPWFLPLAGFLIATCRTLGNPALMAYLPGVIDREDMPAMLGMLSFALKSGAVVVPLFLGAVPGGLNLVPAFLTNALGFLLSALIFLTLPAVRPARAQGAGVHRAVVHRAGVQGATKPETTAPVGGSPPAASPTLIEDLQQGLRLLNQNRALLVAILSCSLASLMRGTIYRYALPLLATGALQAGEEGYRLLQLAQGIGGLTGALLIGWATRQGRNHLGTTLLSWVVSGAGQVVLGMAPLLLGPRGLLLGTAGLVVSSLPTTIAYSATNMAIQSTVPQEHIGKVTGLFAMLDFTGDYGAVLLLPLVLNWLPVEGALAAFGLVTAVVTGAAYLQFVWNPAATGQWRATTGPST